MKVIWKRPDGFLTAEPKDFRVYDLSSGTRIWLHKEDLENFPFRVSGGWDDEHLTRRLNILVNLLGKEGSVWQKELNRLFHDSQAESTKAFIADMKKWFAELKASMKGDTWELEIIKETLEDVESQLHLE